MILENFSVPGLINTHNHNSQFWLRQNRATSQHRSSVLLLEDFLLDNVEAVWDIVHQWGGGLQKISDMQLPYDPLHFLYCFHLMN